MPFLTMHLWQNNVAGSTCGLDFNTNERGNEAWPGVQERGEPITVTGCSMTSGTVLKEHPGAFLEPPSFSYCDKLRLLSQSSFSLVVGGLLKGRHRWTTGCPQSDLVHPSLRTPNATLTWGDEVSKMGNNRKLSNVLHGARPDPEGTQRRVPEARLGNFSVLATRKAK
ncbi:predicted protein [Histoplasma capsulatum H143]|uniref:Uncharacterized protein n=1 Tax=Ajellomyces capsulatus (strain H143) TaxID=544712 RepID=C6HD58_AJECH|nr:predicted protein [Histoplasma capsulatum H143]